MHQASVLTCLYWRSHRSPEEERNQTNKYDSQNSCSRPFNHVLTPSLTICLKTLESLVLEKVLSGTQRGISPSLELALVRCIFAIIAFSSFCSEGTTRRLDQLFSCNTTQSERQNKWLRGCFFLETRLWLSPRMEEWRQIRIFKIISFTNLPVELMHYWLKKILYKILYFPHILKAYNFITQTCIHTGYSQDLLNVITPDESI